MLVPDWLVLRLLSKSTLNTKIEYLEFGERFGMSGPWIGKLKIDNILLKYEFLHENFIYSSDRNLILFNRFEGYSRNERIFRILVLNKLNQKHYLSKLSWKAMYLTKFDKEEIYFTNAFHDGDRQKFPEKSILFNHDNFLEINLCV